MTEHEELLMLRALAAKQAQELEASRRIIAERDEKIRKQNIQIDNMIQALLHARKKLFGPSTEVTQMDGQLSLFESVQELAEQLNLSKEKITMKPYARTARYFALRHLLRHLQYFLILNRISTCIISNPFMAHYLALLLLIFIFASF